MSVDALVHRQQLAHVGLVDEQDLHASRSAGTDANSAEHALGIDVAARDDRSPRARRRGSRDLAGEQRGGGRGARALDVELGARQQQRASPRRSRPRSRARSRRRASRATSSGSAPTNGGVIPSASVPAGAATGTGLPAASAGRHARARPRARRRPRGTPGASALTARRDAAHQPAAADRHDHARRRPATSSTISSPTVPAPASPTGSSNGWTNVSAACAPPPRAAGRTAWRGRRAATISAP